VKAIPLSQFSSSEGTLVQREGWASSEPVWCLLHGGPGVGPGLSVLLGRLDMETQSV